MADLKISALTAATTPLAGTEVLPIVQSGSTVKVATNDLTVRNVRAAATTGIVQVSGPTAGTTRTMTVPDANFTVARTDVGQTFTGNQSVTGTVTASSQVNSGASFEARGTPAAFFSTGGMAMYTDSAGNGYLKSYGNAGGTGGQSINLLVSNTNVVTVNTVDIIANVGNVVIGTSGKGVTNSTGSVALNFSTAGTSLNSAQSVLSGSFPNVGTAQTITITDTNGGYVVITGVQGGVGSSTWTLPFAKRGGSIAIGTPSKAILTADPILSVAASSGNIVVTPLAGNTYFTFAIYYTPLGA